MSHESRSLGRGLSALLAAPKRPSVPIAPTLESTHKLLLSVIAPGKAQPRRGMEQQPLEELAASIAARGVVQPILVRPISSETAGHPLYEIVAGERRWRAAQMAGLTEIPVVIQELSDQDAVAIALIENIQREELTPAEEARAFRRLIEEFALTHQLVAESVGRSRAAVSNLLRLLDLPDEVIEMVDSRSLSMGQARALLSLETDAERLRCAALVLQRGLSVRATEKLVRDTLKGQGEATPARPSGKLAIISDVLKTDTLSVRLHQQAGATGKLVVEFSDLRLRDAIIAFIKSQAAR